MSTWQKIIILLICYPLLYGCQNTAKEDTKPYALAVSSGSNTQRTKYVPVAMPGQLMSLKAKGPKHLTGEEAIEAANKKSVKQPNSGEYINSIMTFDYMPGALYQIYSAPLSITDVQFQVGERVIAVGAGDSMRWQVSKTYSGSGDGRQEHLLIKPIEDGLTNSLVVTTDQRTYHLMLHAKPKTYMASVAWRYPDGDGMITKFEDGDSISDVTSGIDVSRLNFNYKVKKIKGPQPDWYPRMVFNDGKKTFIKFPNHVQDSPTLFIGDSKNSQIVNFRPQGNYYIVDSIFYNAQLRSGQDNQTVVQISMKTR